MTTMQTLSRLRIFTRHGINTPGLLVALTLSTALATSVTYVHQPSGTGTTHIGNSGSTSQTLTLHQSQAASTGAAASQSTDTSADNNHTVSTAKPPLSASLEAQAGPASVSASVSGGVDTAEASACQADDTCIPPTNPPILPSCPACGLDTGPGYSRCLIACPLAR